MTDRRLLRLAAAALAPWLLGLALLLPAAADAGILAGSTRLVYREGDGEHTLMIANTNDYPVLVQTWVDDGSGNPDTAQAPFVALPAVFRLQPKALQGLRVLYNEDPLPRDRESVFWLNLYEMPPTRAHDAGTPRVVLAMDTQLKIFYRPRQLPPMTTAEVAAKLRFTLRREGDLVYLICHNPTPYHASFTTLSVLAGKQAHAAAQQPDMMAPPFGEHTYRLPAFPPAAAGPLTVRFGLLDDQGTAQEHEALVDNPS
ncbi:fimbrial biogenesis chaperone [Frateuria defendens]|uniref:fimbrial biogenesis chaperone n=1 Tax=Frateuria defendens TaxID=2219559 RepID=UPI00069D389B|nr:molecular chaperone [Frateuria defendens]